MTHMNRRYNTHPNHNKKKRRVIEIVQTWSLAKQIGILFMCFWIILMIRECRACFILHSAWIWALCLKMGSVALRKGRRRGLVFCAFVFSFISYTSLKVPGLCKVVCEWCNMKSVTIVKVLVALLFRTSEERTLRLHASLPATRWPRHACTRRERVSAERVVQAFFVPYKNAGLQFQLSLWSCVRFSVCLGMILATWLKETFVYRAVKDVLAFEFFLGRNRECFVRTDIWHPPWASPRFTCRAGLLCCLWKHGSTVPLVSWSCVRFEVCLGMIFATWLKETFVYHAVQDVLAFELFLGRNRECLVRTDIVVSESALRVSCRPYLLSVKTRVYCSSCLVVVCSFQDLSGNDIHYISEGDFHLSCCARSFISYRFSWEKSWMFCENCACPEFCEYPIVLCRAVECVWLAVVVQ